jgi:ankyrin repeat protein
LDIAAYHGQIEVVDLLLENHVDANHINDYGITALGYAAWKGHISVVKQLLRANASPKLGNATQRPLRLAASAIHSDVVHLLLSETLEMEDRWSAVVETIRLDRIDQLTLLLEGNIELRDEDGQTLLHVGAFNGSSVVVDWLLAKGASITATDKKGRQPLACAAKYGEPEIVEILLKQNVALSAQDDDGDTALHHASYHNNIDVVDCY